MEQVDFQIAQSGIRIILLIEKKDPITGTLGPLNLADISAKSVNLKKPDGTIEGFFFGAVIFTPPPEGVGDGSDGKLEFTVTATTTLDQAGTYEVQAQLTFGADIGFTQISTFTVGENL